MAAGVTIEDPDTTYVDADVTIGRRHDHPPRASPSRGSTTHRLRLRDPPRRPHRRLAPSTTTSSILDHCVIDGRANCRARARSAPSRTCGRQPTSSGARTVGNFVELKKTRLGAGSKADPPGLPRATPRSASDVNVGAGTITCNYDGVRKNPTVIEDGAFIGSDSAARRAGHGRPRAPTSPPARRSRRTCPPARSAIARGQQENNEGWVERRRSATQTRAPELRARAPSL